jgi:hypothetical protein
MLPSAPQFILWRPAPGAKPGKTDKLPVDHRSLRVADPHDPAIWTDYATARTRAVESGLGVGFVFTAADPYWFLDLDNCRTPAGWSPLAAEMCQTFAGVYVEVSHSETGLHLIGSGYPPPHACRSPDGMEFYSSGRFCALTGTHAQGSAQRDCTALLPALVTRYFPPTAASGSLAVLTAEWTDGPCAAWSGPEDDDELIGRMLASTTAAAAFGAKASPRALWTADVVALGKAFPDGQRDYDASAADAALARHLAFWTGRDCERIRRLMERSALAREKWAREDYLPRTILKACEGVTQVLGRQVAPGVPAPPEAPAAAAGPSAPASIGGLLLASDMAKHFEGCVYIEDRYAAAVPDGSVLAPPQFRTSGRYGGYKFMLDDAKTTRNAWEAFAESGTYRPPMAHTMCFRPELPARGLIDENSRTLFNSYVPVQVRRLEGDATPFLTHLAKLLPHETDRNILVAWLASAVQNIGSKFQWSPLIQGCEGNGKTVLADVMAYAIGEEYCHRPSAPDVANKFNAWIDRKLLIILEEIYTRERKELEESLKVYITNRRIEMQSKGGNQVMIDNRANFLLLTNHKDAISAIGGSRRYCSLLTAQQEYADIVRDGMDGDYFPNLYAWLRADGFAIVAHYFQSYVIPAALDPAGACHRAPQTSSTAEAVEAAQSPVEQALLEAIASGERGFAGGWVSSHFLGLLLDARRLRAGCPPNAWDSVLQRLGYIKHPALPGGRVNNVVMPDGIKSRLWVRRDSIPALNCPTAADAARAYSTANGGFGTAAATA